MAIGFGLLTGIPLGTIAALKQNTTIDYAASFFAVLGLSVPSLVLGPVLIWIFALKLGWFPVSTWGAQPPFFLGFIPAPTKDFFMHAALPVTALGLALTASIARLARASLLQVIGEDYIRTARQGAAAVDADCASRLAQQPHPGGHHSRPADCVGRNRLVCDRIRVWHPGMGKHFITSINNRDYSMISGVTLVYALLLVIANMIVDIMRVAGPAY